MIIPYVPTDPYSRLRGGAIVRRGQWSQSRTFGRCKFCNHTTINGCCPSCGMVVRCASCKRIRVREGVWVTPPTSTNHASDTLCFDCVKLLYPEQAAGILAKRKLRKALEEENHACNMD